jgi:transcription termination/antitermination protein NusG
MGTSDQSWQFPELSSFPGIDADADVEEWYALQTRARHEKAVVQRLSDKGVTTFLPLLKQVHRWSDRRKTVEVPLFGCYVFAKLPPQNDQRLRVLVVDGVLSFVGPRGQGIPIPEEQIDAVRKLIEEQLPYCSHPFLKIGQRVRVRGGSLDGVEGILTSRSGERKLVISVDAIQRSLGVCIEGYDVEPV